MMEFFGWIIATVLVLLTVGVHYEIIRLASDVVIPWAFKRFHDRRIMMLSMATLVAGHIIEIWVFALSMMFLTLTPDFGHLSGSVDSNLNTYLYFSAVSYTSTGYGDITPHGALRSVAVSEALAGLMMIAWSASFTYLKMEEIWKLRRTPQPIKKS